MLEVRAVRCTDHHQTVKQVLAKVAAVELVAELIQILLQELRTYAVIHVGQQRLGIRYGNMHPGQHTANVLRVDDLRLMFR